jgi:glutathione synthase
VTEINVTSPTGILELDKQCGIHIGELLIAAIERRLAAAARTRAGGATSAVAARPAG